MCGPTSVGALWGRAELLESMAPFNLGGHMIRSVTLEETTWGRAAVQVRGRARSRSRRRSASAPRSTTSPTIGIEAIEEHERELLVYALERLADVPGFIGYGPPADRRAGIISFNIEGIHPHDVAQVLDMEGVAIRAGPPLLPAADGRSWASPRRTARASTSTRSRRRSTASSQGLHKAHKLLGQ